MNVLKVVILLITYLLCVTSKTEDLTLRVFKMITGINLLKTLANVNVNLMEENSSRINGGITINVNVKY